MLTRHVMDDTSRQTTRNWWAALVAVLIAFGGMVVLVMSWSRFQVGPGAAPGDLVLLDFGKALTAPNQFAIPFEVSSVLLLAALIGSIYVAVERKGGNQ
jgi:NADH:ubiquinone oxidoreductase subunit 6 (subunit J)